MKVNSKIFSFPSIVSVTWDQVCCLSLEKHPELDQKTLTLTLKNGKKFHLPPLKPEEIHHIFIAHARYAIEKGQQKPIFQTPNAENSPTPAQLPPKSLPSLNELKKPLLNALLKVQLSKIAQESQITKQQALESHIAEENDVVEQITSEDLSFSSWRILEVAKNRYQLSDVDDPSLCFEVSLHKKVSCSCGQKSCEHIKTVLRS